ncbi:MAG: hypothetical protein FDZ75_04195, partial [Actinobacteria bacterium]
MATKKQTIMWTACPTGFTTARDGSQKLKLSVFVAPRLETSALTGVLGEYPDFQGTTVGKNWASTVAGLSFKVETAPALGAVSREFDAT